MTITVEYGEQRVVFRDVTDAYLAVRQITPAARSDDPEQVVQVVDTRGYSWGSNLRDLVKEMAQGLVELQEMLPGAPEAPGAGS